MVSSPKRKEKDWKTTLYHPLFASNSCSDLCQPMRSQHHRPIWSDIGWQKVLLDGASTRLSHEFIGFGWEVLEHHTLCPSFLYLRQKWLPLLGTFAKYSYPPLRKPCKKWVPSPQQKYHPPYKKFWIVPCIWLCHSMDRLFIYVKKWLQDGQKLKSSPTYPTLPFTKMWCN